MATIAIFATITAFFTMYVLTISIEGFKNGTIFFMKFFVPPVIIGLILSYFIIKYFV